MERAIDTQDSLAQAYNANPHAALMTVPDPNPMRFRLLLILVPAFLFPAFPSAAGPTAPGERPENDPILEALSERLAASRAAGLPSGSAARLKLEILEILPGSGTRPLGRFTAPLDPQRPARLSRRVELQEWRNLAAVSLDVEIDIRFRPLGAERARFDLESRVSTAAPSAPGTPFGAGARGESGDVRVRQASEELGVGRSSLLEAFQVAGTPRRLLIALSWELVPAAPGSEPEVGTRPAPPSQMVDLQLSLIRLEQGKEEPLKQQRISTGLGAEARSLLRLTDRPLGRDEDQQIEVRLTPRSVDRNGLRLGIEVRGALQGDQDAPRIWIDHQDDVRIGSGHRYSLELGGEGGSPVTYRLDIRPYY